MKLALDIGNSAVKGTLLDDNNNIITSINFPSVCAHISDEKYLTYNNETDYYIQINESKLNHYDDIVAVGKKAINLPDYKEYDVTSTSYKANNELTTSLLFGALAPYLTSDVELKLAVSVPIVEAKHLGLLNEYKDLLLGEHKITVYNEKEVITYTVNIVKTAVLNEGQAGFLGMLDTIDDDFRSKLDIVYKVLEEDEDPVSTFEDFLIVDIGEGTTDLAVFRSKEFNPDYSYSITRGYGNLLEDAMKTARRENLTIESRKELQNVLESTNKRRQERKDTWLGYVTPTRNQFIQTIVDTIIKTYGSRDYFDAIIFIGGGFTALTGYEVSGEEIIIRDDYLFTELENALERHKKSADLIFGIPAPYAQTINDKGLTQVLTAM